MNFLWLDVLWALSALPLLVWVWWFHVADAAQTMANFVLRSHRVTLMPLVFYVTSLWGIGLGGGYWVTTSTWASAARCNRPCHGRPLRS